MELLLKTDLGPGVDCDTPSGKLLSAIEERRLKSSGYFRRRRLLGRADRKIEIPH
jgi:hypothetical protein